MKVLDLLAGTRSLAKVADQRGHSTFSIELDDRHKKECCSREAMRACNKDL